MMTDMSHLSASSALFATTALHPDHVFSRRRTLQIMVKARDELGGRLTDRGRVRKILDHKEKRTINRGYERARQILKRAGAKDVFRTNYFAAHPGGTVKVGHWVDSDLKTQYDNLYECDCSVIPISWSFSATSTLIALGKRLARHLG